MSELRGLQPTLLWSFFDDIRRIPRPSGKEEKVADYLVNFAKQEGLEHKKDDAGNVLIRQPGTPGHEDAQPVVLQAHMDMVCEKNSDKEFDFDNDEIQVLVEDEWVTADGTTLGADNGIGVAAILAVMSDKKCEHGPIEGLFTVDEERGLVGATSISTDWLKGRTLINVDSEDIGIFSIGCAGGSDTHVTLPVKRTDPKGDTVVQIHLSGLRGGHSGIDIHEGRGNALKILNRLLYQLSKNYPVELMSINGGDKHNAIPREAIAKVVMPGNNIKPAEEWLNHALASIREEFHPVEKNIALKVEQINDPAANVLDKQSQRNVIALTFAFPHGPLEMSRTIKDLVETSNNVASIKCNDNEVKFHLSSRSSNDTALQATLDKFEAISAIVGANVHQPPGYPGWMPNLDSNVLQVALDTYKKVTGEDATYEAIHAGLECGLIGEKFEGMDMISIGPTLKHPHSPDEKVHINSVQVFYNHLVKMLEVLA